MRKHWTSGFFWYEKVYYIYGLYEYFTSYKQGNINTDNPDYTKDPQWIQIITFSRGIPKLNKDILEATKNDLTKIKDDLRKDFIEKYGREPQCSYTGHKYIDYQTGEIKYCLDREYWH